LPESTPRKRAPRKAAAKPPKPELIVERRRVADLLPDPSNARKHSARNIAAIRASLRRFGQRKPLVLDVEGVVVAGNGTLQAMQDEGTEWVDVVVYPGTPAEARAYAIADNRTAELASWDMDVLPDLLDNLPDDLVEASGYTPDEIERLVSEAGGTPHDSGTEDKYEGRWELVIECDGEEQQRTLYEKLTEEGLTVRTLTL
jgi:ParB-like chromosome segregation protein Spo0J